MNDAHIDMNLQHSCFKVCRVNDWHYNAISLSVTDLKINQHVKCLGCFTKF